MATHDLSDETLMAYADGALDGVAAKAVEKAAAEDDAVAQRIALFRATGDVLATARAARPAEPVPETLMARVQAVLDAGRDTPGDTPVVPFARPATGDGASRRLWAPMALAASLALAIGLATGLTLRPPAAPDAAPAFATLEAGGIAAALSRLEAGASERVAAGEISVISSFRMPDGGLCREFELDAESAAMVGVACAEGTAWGLRFAVATGPGAGEDGQRDYAPAGALEALDTWMMGIGAGAPLSPQEERAALSSLAD